jgi:hypothetical protein
MSEYVVEGKKYLHIKNFRKHQKIDRPSSPRVPLYEPSMNAREDSRTLDEYSTSPRALREGKGREEVREGNGEGSKNKKNLRGDLEIAAKAKNQEAANGRDTAPESDPAEAIRELANRLRIAK